MLDFRSVAVNDTRWPFTIAASYSVFLDVKSTSPKKIRTLQSVQESPLAVCKWQFLRLNDAIAFPNEKLLRTFPGMLVLTYVKYAPFRASKSPFSPDQQQFLNRLLETSFY
ncbi:hypothetical protein B7W85_24785 [Allorhizobium ampelinum]|nr:hypothetical protein B7W85_24785 [Allorhizobium ampelinum]